MPAATRQRDLVPRASASAAALFGCHWAEVQRFLLQAQAAGLVADSLNIEGWWESVLVVVDHGDRIEWQRQGHNCFGNFSETHQLHRRDCCSCHTPTACLQADGLMQCRSCRLKYDRQKGREYTAKWRYKKTGALPVWVAGSVACSHCGATFTPKRSTARFCSAACRVAAHRASASV